MKKILNILAVAFGVSLLAGAAHANFTLFDMAKDSMYIARGEFVSLERTGVGDRLTLRCDKLIKGELAVGTQVALEVFEPAPADEALGRDVIVGFNLIHGKYYFLHHPTAQRGAFYFETDDKAANGLDQSERALRNFIAINAPHTEAILQQLRLRLQLESQAYEGVFETSLIDAWKAELLNEMAWSGTWAARDAAKALVDHDLFKGNCTPDEIDRVGAMIPASEVGGIGRAYMLERVRHQKSAHPALSALVAIVREETSQACVGKTSNLLLAHEDRAKVLAEMGAIINDTLATPQMRCNALQILGALRDKNGLSFVHDAIRAEMNRGNDNSKPILRRAFDALKTTPGEASIGVITDFQASEICTKSWEMTQYSWIAMSMIDTEATNQKVALQLSKETNPQRRKFYQLLLPQNKVWREVMIIHPES